MNAAVTNAGKTGLTYVLIYLWLLNSGEKKERAQGDSRNKFSERSKLIVGDRSSSIGKHYSVKHCIVSKDLDKQFFVLKKCNNKFDCLVHEILLIRELTPSD